MEYLTLKEIQTESYNVLQTINKICKENNIRYFLAYGSLIGAIRNNGIIPWDDDIDIWMPRNDYEKFVNICNGSTIPNNYKLCTKENTDYYWYGIARFSNLDFRYVTQSENFDIGVFVDIYPIDNYGNNEKKGKVLQKRIFNLHRIYAYRISKYKIKDFKSLIKKFIHFGLFFIPQKKCLLFINSKISKLLSIYTTEDDDLVGVPIWDTYGYMSFKKQLFNESIEWEFEGGKFPVPKHYDEILKKIYGDYLKLPPVEKRVSHHDYKIYRRNV